MSFNFPYTLAAGEKIPIVMQSNSVMRGIDRTALKSPTQLRKVGYFYHGIYPYYTHNPVPPNPGLPFNDYLLLLDAYDAKFYLAQTDFHLDIDPILATMEFTRQPAVDTSIGYATLTPPFFDHQHFHTNSILISNAEIVAKFQTNASLPPNTRVYFMIANTDLTWFETNSPQITGDLPQVSYNIGEAPYYLTGQDSPPRPFTQGTGVFRLGNDFSTGAYSAGINSRGGYVAQFRTDNTGRVQGLNLASPATGFNGAGGGKMISTFSCGEHRNSDQELIDDPFNDGTPLFWEGLRLEVRKVVDRYDTGTNPSNPTPEGFHARMYQELIDNEWDTKVVTDA